MKTPLQQIIDRYDRGIKIHKEMMDDPTGSPVEKNRHSYLYYHCVSMRNVAFDMLEEERNNIIDAHMKGGDNAVKKQAKLNPLPDAVHYYNKKYLDGERN